MALVSWNPATDLEAFRHQMDRMVNRIFLQNVPGLPRLDLSRLVVPSVEVYVSGQTLVVKAELPGVSPDDITVELTDRTIYLAGEVRRDSEATEDQYYRTERQYGRFERSLTLPYQVKDQEARAQFKEGLLTVRMPLVEPVEQPRARKVPIEK